MSLPKSLIQSATLGTENSPVEFMVGKSDVGSLIRERQNGNIQRQLLATAAGVRLQQLAGWIPPSTSDGLDAPCEVDGQRMCSKRALAHLVMMLRRRHSELLPRWLKEVAEYGQIAPQEVLPLLLELGRREKRLRDLILPVLGKRGQWLGEIATTHDWCWFKPRNVKWRWERGSDATRIELIEVMRKTDPAQARELVMETWEQENKNTRQSFVTAFEVGLSHADEPFLETVLDDRAPSVRDEAIKLLARWPESRFRQRMMERAALCLTYDRSGPLPMVKVNAAHDFDDAVLRDGLNPKGIEGTLLKVVSYIDPQYWCDSWGISIEALFESIRQNEAQQWILYETMISAVINTQSAAFAPFVFEYVLETGRFQYWTGLMELLPAEDKRRYAAEFLRLDIETKQNAHPAIDWLAGSDVEWSVELTQAVIDYIHRVLAREMPRVEFILRSRLPFVAVNMPASLQNEFLEGLAVQGAVGREWRAMQGEIYDMLAFRTRMLDAIRGES